MPCSSCILAMQPTPHHNSLCSASHNHAHLAHCHLFLAAGGVSA